MFKYNEEGYFDPTAWVALTRVYRGQTRMDLVYICSPYRGDTKLNTERARTYCRFAVENNKIPIAPHIFFPQFIDDDNPEERQKAMAMNTKLITHCREVWVFGNKITEGMESEIKYARKQRIPIKRITEAMI